MDTRSYYEPLLLELQNKVAQVLVTSRLPSIQRILLKGYRPWWVKYQDNINQIALAIKPGPYYTIIGDKPDDFPSIKTNWEPLYYTSSVNYSITAMLKNSELIIENAQILATKGVIIYED